MKRITLEQQAEAIERWKAAEDLTGRDYVPANGGARRTRSKRALLSAMSDAAAQRGVKPAFDAKY
jgi:hypothetical protein